METVNSNTSSRWRPCVVPSCGRRDKQRSSFWALLVSPPSLTLYLFRQVLGHVSVHRVDGPPVAIRPPTTRRRSRESITRKPSAACRLWRPRHVTPVRTCPSRLRVRCGATHCALARRIPSTTYDHLGESRSCVSRKTMTAVATPRADVRCDNKDKSM